MELLGCLVWFKKWRRAHRGRSEMAVHLTACRHGLAGGIGVGVELSEILLDGQQARAIITFGPDSIGNHRAGTAGEGQLGHLLAVSEDAELGFAGQDLLSDPERRFRLMQPIGNHGGPPCGGHPRFRARVVFPWVDGAAQKYR